MFRLERYAFRWVLLGGLCAMFAGTATADEIPGSGGKLDFGMSGLDIPAPGYTNATPPRTVELLQAAIGQAKASFLKAQLIVELGTTRLPQALPVIVPTLADADPGVRASGAFALATVADARAKATSGREAVLADATMVTRLSALLKDPDVQVRSAALTALVAIQGGDSPAVIVAIEGTDPELQATAIEIADGPKAGAAIAGKYSAIPESVKPRAIVAMGRCKTASALSLIHGAAASKDEVMQVAACRAMQAIASGDSAPVARTLTDSGRATVAREAIRAYGACAEVPDRVTLALVKLDHTDPTIRQAAVVVLGENLNPSVVGSVVAQLSTEYPPLYLAARKALISAKDAATREACIAAAGVLLHDAGPRRQEDGSYVLGRYRSAHELDRHIRLLAHDSNPDWRLVKQVAESLGLIGRQEARKPIAEMVLHGDAIISHGGTALDALDTAYVAAGRLAASETLPVCAGILALQDPRNPAFRLRAAAVFVIGAAGTEQSPEAPYVYRMLASPMDPKIEPIKAIGNLKLKDGVAKLQAGYPMDDAYANRWMAEWAIARIKGEPAQHQRSTYPWTATTSYKDLSGK